MEKEKLYNDLGNTCIINLYTLSKECGFIELKNFDTKNYNHLFLFEMAKVAQTLFNIPIFIECSFFKFLFLKKKNKKIKRKNKKNSTNYCIEPDEFLEYITKANEIDKNIWEEIYKDWYIK